MSKKYIVINFQLPIKKFFDTTLNMSEMSFDFNFIMNELFIKFNERRHLDESIRGMIIDLLSFRYNILGNDLTIFAEALDKLMTDLSYYVFNQIPHLPHEMLVLEDFIREEDLIVSIKENPYAPTNSQSRSFSADQSFGW